METIDTLYGHYRHKSLWVLLGGGALVVTLLALALVIFLAIHREWPGHPVDLAIVGGTMVGLLTLLRITHSGKRLSALGLVYLAMLKAADSFHAITYWPELARSMFWAFTVGLIALLSAFALQRMVQCFGVVVAIGPKGVYIRYVSKRWIPWSYVERVEEFTEFGATTFRLILNTRAHLGIKFFWALWEKHPTLSARFIDLRTAQLREALFSRGQILPR